MQILMKLAVILFPVLTFSQISFYRYYADEGYDFGQGIVQLDDSSYVITGTSGSFGDNSQAFLMQVDSLGNRLWSNHYGGVETDWGRRVLHKENFGYYVCGYSNSFSSGDYDFYLVKVAENGLEEWSRTYGSADWEKLWDAVMTQDTGTVLVGERQNGLFGKDMYVVRTNVHGDTVWTKTFEHHGDDIATSVDIYQDSLIVIGGTLFHQDSSQMKSVIYMMHENGQMIDTLLYDSYVGDYELNDMQVIGDTVQSLGSNLGADNSGQWNYTFYRADISSSGLSNPFLFNSQALGDWHGDVFASYDNNAYRYMAYSLENNANVYPGGRDAHIQRGNSFMFFVATVAWLAMDQPDVNGEMIRTSDGGAILVGYHQNLNIGNGGGTIFLYKIGPGEVYPDASAMPFPDPLVSVANQSNLLQVLVYPNPANSNVNIELPSNEMAFWKLFDVSGKKMSSGSLHGHGLIPLNNLTQGVYFLEVETSRGRAREKLLVR
jgi:hypothetical protein